MSNKWYWAFAIFFALCLVFLIALYPGNEKKDETAITTVPVVEDIATVPAVEVPTAAVACTVDFLQQFGFRDVVTGEFTLAHSFPRQLTYQREGAIYRLPREEHEGLIRWMDENAGDIISAIQRTSGITASFVDKGFVSDVLGECTTETLETLVSVYELSQDQWVVEDGIARYTFEGVSLAVPHDALQTLIVGLVPPTLEPTRTDWETAFSYVQEAKAGFIFENDYLAVHPEAVDEALKAMSFAAWGLWWEPGAPKGTLYLTHTTDPSGNFIVAGWLVSSSTDN